jgi:hypothetical protein
MHWHGGHDALNRSGGMDENDKIAKTSAIHSELDRHRSDKYSIIAMLLVA